MPKRPYSQISSSGMCLTNQSTTTPTSITDLPVDVLCLVFEHLPLSEVLRNQALVCKAFYDAHLQHCRSSVKHLTLLGHYMLKEHSNAPVEPQSEIVRKQTLFEYARNTSSISSLATINPSRCHLKLVVGLEESAYAAIGTKFQSVTSLELYQPAMERHYKPITTMINAWGGGGGGEKKKKKVTGGGGGGDSRTNQLTELKIFFNKEMYSSQGAHIKSGNKSCCLAYLLAEALTPDKAPALRRLVIVPGNWRGVAGQNRGNHNNYRGQLLEKINLSQVTAIDAPGFAVIGLPAEERSGGGKDHPAFTALRELTFRASSGKDAVRWATATIATSLLRRLTSLSVTAADYLNHRFVGALQQQQQQQPTETEGEAVVVGAALRRLSVKGAASALTELLQQLVVPLTTTKGKQDDNDRLEELRVAWDDHRSSETQPVGLAPAVANAGAAAAAGAVVATESLRVRFPALTTLHLVKSTLLHRDDEMSALSALFPNLAHLRLDHNHRADGLRHIKWPSHDGQRHCEQCVQHVWDAFLQCNPGAQADGNYLVESTGNVQLLPSSTAPACKAALIRRAVAAWPRLASITLQIDDFFRVTNRSVEMNNEAVSRLQYLYRCECLLLRDPLTGEPLQEEDLKWTVQEVLY